MFGIVLPAFVLFRNQMRKCCNQEQVFSTDVKMTSTSDMPPQVKIIFFDVFGTCVSQIPPVADELHSATQDTLKTSSMIGEDIRKHAEQMAPADWIDFATEWNASVDAIVASSKANGSVDWHAVDHYYPDCLTRLLAERGLLTLNPTDAGTANPGMLHTTISEGSLFTPSQISHLAKIWSRLPPYPDTLPGLRLLNEKYTTCALSNTYHANLARLVALHGMPFKEILTADDFASYKPNPKVYLAAAERMGVRPEECALVAAHLNDLNGAKACGFYTIYVERGFEEKSPKLVGTGIEELMVGMHETEDLRAAEKGLVALARKLGIE